jgi:hypothetical protein
MKIQVAVFRIVTLYCDRIPFLEDLADSIFRKEHGHLK